MIYGQTVKEYPYKNYQEMRDEFGELYEAQKYKEAAELMEWDLRRLNACRCQDGDPESQKTDPERSVHFASFHYFLLTHLRSSLPFLPHRRDDVIGYDRKRGDGFGFVPVSGRGDNNHIEIRDDNDALSSPSVRKKGGMASRLDLIGFPPPLIPVSIGP